MATTQAHRELAHRLEEEAARSPRAYLVRLALLAALGYGLLLVLLAIAFGLPLLMLWHILANGARPGPELAYAVLLPLVFGAVVLRALWIRLGVPEGYVLGRGEAPALQEEVERLRQAAGAPALHGIVIDGELNAAAASVPRALGLLGHRHYLVLGLPLMQLFDREELAAVIAHEFGHFGSGHGGFGGWIYRVRLSWYRVLDGLAGSGFMFSRLLFKFYEWYVPYFNACSFALARRNEYEADAAAVAAVGREAAASALVRLELGARRVHGRFWPQVFDRARAQGHPPAAVHAQLVRALRADAPADLERVLEIAARDSDPEDTHPTLPQRLAAMAAGPQLRARGQAAAPALLGAALLAEIERGLDEYWRERVRAQWRQRYEEAAAARAQLAALEGLGAPGAQERLEHARLVESLRVDFDAEPLYARLLEAHPDSAMAHYRAGVLALRRGDADLGAARLRRAVTLDAGAVRPVVTDLETLAGDPDLDAACAVAVRSLREELAPAAQELAARDAAAADDEMLPHGLDAAALAALAEVLAAQPRIARAWLVRKRIAMAEAQAHFVLLLDWRGPVAGEGAALKRLVDALSLPGSFTAFTGSNERALAQRVRALCGEPVYRKGAR
ncbi:M48 family metalloprotease [Luteimonas sp. SJ-92]|uniref:M48 family metalloprotease n=1 Tax=Luteimonas salinisoli TaxID=2752307 RepID=A0A853JC77_9GAMM|nr:M48 family metallopeptidase [Luteimonas salinisoli]NZA26853.1 M48 family metalloprotease [Luteimonas salinisoli]